MKLRYFKEKESGDYGAIVSKPDVLGYWGRATCLTGDPTSMSTTRLGLDFLRDSVRIVSKKSIPKKWLKAINGETI